MRLIPTIPGNPICLLTGLTFCVTVLPVFAEEPTTSREYPQTYTDRVTPWYDPSGWFRKIENVINKDEPPVKSDKLPVVTAVPVSMQSPVSPMMAGPADGQLSQLMPGNTGPAWKWYGYGTVTPNQNPHAPQGNYRPVPADWHAQTGATPGAIPNQGSSLLATIKPQPETPSSVAKPLENVGAPPVPPSSAFPEIGGIAAPEKERKPAVADIAMPILDAPKEKVEEPNLPGVITPPPLVPATPVKNTNSEPEDVTPPAMLKAPKPAEAETPAIETTPAPGFGASLRRPVRIDAPETPTPVTPAPAPMPTPAPAVTMPEQPRPPAVEQRPPQSAAPLQPSERPDGAALPNANTESPDIPVEAAPGIVIPGGSMSRLQRPNYIARAQQPSPLEDAIRRAAGDIVRDIRPAGPNALTVVLKPGNIDAAWRAREQLSKLPELKRLTVTFEIPAR